MAKSGTKVTMIKLEYFSQIYAEYHSLEKAQRQQVFDDCPKSLKDVIEKMDNGESSLEALDWHEIQIFEMKVLSRQPDANLSRQAWNVRSQYERMVGPEEFKLYLDSNPPTSADPAALRIDLAFLVSIFHWTFSMALLRETLRKRISTNISIWTCVVVAVLGAFLVYFHWDNTRLVAPVLALVVMMGVIGGYISVLRRLQTPISRSNPIVGALSLNEYSAVAKLSLVFGGLFAIVFWLILVGGFVKGDLFPAFLQDQWHPSTVVDWAKLLIWAFLAGFAERLVPDTLDRLVNPKPKEPLDGATVSPVPIPPVPNAKPAPPDPAPILEGVQREIEKLGAAPRPAGETREQDANRGLFGEKAESQGWTLSASVDLLPVPSGLARIKLHVVPKEGTPAAEKAIFHLSKNFLQPRVEVPIANGSFTHETLSFYPFVVGVELLPGGPKLELDLASPGVAAPEEWKTN